MYKKNIESTIHTNLVSLFVTVLAITAIITPFALVYAASSDYDFTMNYSVVNGCDNDEFHTLSSGSGYIEGSADAYNSSLDVYYTLERDVWGPNPDYGTVNGGINQSFNLGFPDTLISDSNYCLIVWRNGFDSITVTGDGTLHN